MEAVLASLSTENLASLCHLALACELRFADVEPIQPFPEDTLEDLSLALSAALISCGCAMKDETDFTSQSSLHPHGTNTIRPSTFTPAINEDHVTKATSGVYVSEEYSMVQQSPSI